jgi:DinB superfamily
MSERRALIAKRMRDEGDRTLAFFRAIPPNQWNTQVYSEGSSWAIREVLCHFLDAEHGLQRVVADVLAGGSGAPEGIDINEWNENAVGKMGHWQPAELIDAFAEARQATLAAFEHADDSNFDRVGRHPVLGVRPLDELIKIMYLHNKAHQRDIQRVLKT